MEIKGQYIAAVSGGPDSMALLKKYGPNIVMVAHVNYNKRPSALRDEEIVKGYCERHNIPFRALSVTDKMYNKYSLETSNFETIAREIRYNFFSSLTAEAGTNKVLVAHNLDDFVETALMQRQRKSMSLFYGIKPINTHHNLEISRPLINIRKQALIDFCNQYDVPYGIDETNDDDYHERNKIRKAIALWPPILFNIFLRIIHAYNQQNEEKSRLVDQIYKEWENTEYDVDYFKKIEEKYYPYIVYKYLIDNNLGYINSNKIASVIDFLLHSNGNKLFRLESNTFIKLK